jgi:exonuclease III
MLAAADIICFQETKVRRGDLDRELALAEGW